MSATQGLGQRRLIKCAHPSFRSCELCLPSHASHEHFSLFPVAFRPFMNQLKGNPPLPPPPPPPHYVLSAALPLRVSNNVLHKPGASQPLPLPPPTSHSRNTKLIKKNSPHSKNQHCGIYGWIMRESDRGKTRWGNSGLWWGGRAA